MNSSCYKVGHVASNTDGTSCGIGALKLWSIRSKFNLIIEEAGDSITEIEKLDSLLNEFYENQVERKKTQVDVPVENVSHETNSLSPIIHVQDPAHPVKTKGRPSKASRIKSSVRLSTKQQRRCSHCKKKEHYRTGCSKYKV